MNKKGYFKIREFSKVLAYGMKTLSLANNYNYLLIVDSLDNNFKGRDYPTVSSVGRL